MKEKEIKKNNDENYKLPSISLLKDFTKPIKTLFFKQIDEFAKILEDTLSDFGIQAKVENFYQGPTVSNFEISLSKGTKVSSVINLSDDIALALAVPSVRIQVPSGDKSLISIEVPNRKMQIVSFKHVITDERIKKYTLPVALGKDVKGQNVVIDIATLPHLLISGTTGSGKSVCIHVIISTLLYKYSPQEVRFLMIDPKIVELSAYEGIPHLIGEVITQPKRAVWTLGNLTKLIENRYLKFREYEVKTLADYNKIEKERPLPYILVIIDELADLMITSARQCEEAIVRIAQIGRAAGVHLVIATQRPSVDVVTGMIKANIPGRIAFACTSKVDSRIIIDRVGAEKLIGKGDMLYIEPSSLRPLRIQASFISLQEVRKIVDFIKSQNIKPQDYEDYNSLSLPPQTEDPLLQEAIEIAKTSPNISISLLQRKLSVGFNRASRLYEILKERGYITNENR